MYRKLIAVGLALALLGVAGSAVTAEDGADPVVADHDVEQELTPDPLDDEWEKCSISTDNDEWEKDGGSGGGGGGC